MIFSKWYKGNVVNCVEIDIIKGAECAHPESPSKFQERIQCSNTGIIDYIFKWIHKYISHEVRYEERSGYRLFNARLIIWSTVNYRNKRAFLDLCTCGSESLYMKMADVKYCSNMFEIIGKQKLIIIDSRHNWDINLKKILKQFLF